MEDRVWSVAFTQDNRSAFVSDMEGNIKIIKWTPNASTEHDLNFDQKTKHVSKSGIGLICLTIDDKNLLVASEKMVSVFKTENM